MRRILLIAAAALAIAALPAGGDPAILCEEECTIPSNGAGYFAPAVVVEAGSSVRWASLDSTHVNRDGLDESTDACFLVSYGTLEPSAPVTFQIESGTLTATTGDTTKVCAGEALGEERVTLPYYCILHPTMRGTLIVTS